MNRVIASLEEGNADEIVMSTRVAGVTFKDNSFKVLSLIKNKVPFNLIRLRLIPDEDNEYDENAVSVYVSIEGSKKFYNIGYIPREISEIVKFILSNPDKYSMTYSRARVLGSEEEGMCLGLHFDLNVQKKVR